MFMCQEETSQSHVQSVSHNIMTSYFVAFFFSLTIGRHFLTFQSGWIAKL